MCDVETRPERDPKGGTSDPLKKVGGTASSTGAEPAKYHKKSTLGFPVCGLLHPSYVGIHDTWRCGRTVHGWDSYDWERSPPKSGNGKESSKGYARYGRKNAIF